MSHVSTELFPVCINETHAIGQCRLGAFSPRSYMSNSMY